MSETVKIVVAWHSQEQIEKFLKAWDVQMDNENFIFQHDVKKEGCAVTKNKGIVRAVEKGVDVVVVLDDDCFPSNEVLNAHELKARHMEQLGEAEPSHEFLVITDPPSRGTPYINRGSPRKAVAASMGFWTKNGDYDACAQIVYGSTHPMKFERKSVSGRYFAMSGMNLAFRPKQWLPWCQFIDVPRFDDIWMGWLWQKEAYRRGYSFSLNGPIVTHSRQSNIWQNLQHEAKWLERNETLWSDIANSDETKYEELRKLLPV